ncbi:endonuclease NucS domain-containing protein [Paucibacter sp. DJ2R-2]|uniref:endonuclease NucS domain-containing protein n=1 Tax=Paucibacter sp. DJ2R-2 TaxID=2893558 RepID=UPI0021E38C6A|nr:endonuclease NucS domain-containing protein [Paucibacter sp. DJ2R-2]MCV2437199.1 endonuclease NucS [Paucibacter sp. DJ2R-2]
MPIQHAIWQVGQPATQLKQSKLSSEALLEEMIVQDPRILSPAWMLIGQQETTSHGGRIDLLAIAPDGSLVLVELKRDRTPREIVAQALDYASWVAELGADRISQIYARFKPGHSLEQDFQQRFGTALDEDSLNHAHQIIIVAAELDPSTERIVQYLNDRDIAINVLFFQVFEHSGQQLLSRAWLIDPSETQANAAVTIATGKGAKEPWNGEFYVSFGDQTSRSWDDAVRYGFISGGGGSWYSKTLKLLSSGDRVWVNIPGRGYVGVGEVLEAVQPASDFHVHTDNGERLAMDVLKHGELYKADAADPELSEYFVRVKWLHTIPAALAFNELGLFGNQNTVCQPTTPKWRHTVERLRAVFKIGEAEASSRD